MINSVVLVGRLVRDPELKYTPAGDAVASFSLAVNRNFKNAQGEREADFINIVIWRKQAENLAKWAKKGALIGITGRIQTRNYENQQGQRVYVTEVVADNFQLLESRSAQNANNGDFSNQNQGGYNSPFGQNNNATGQNRGQYGGVGQTPNFAREESPFGNSNLMDISDDDLPF